jgi:hypothetical protein
MTPSPFWLFTLALAHHTKHHNMANAAAKKAAAGTSFHVLLWVIHIYLYVVPSLVVKKSVYSSTAGSSFILPLILCSSVLIDSSTAATDIVQIYILILKNSSRSRSIHLPPHSLIHKHPLPLPPIHPLQFLIDTLSHLHGFTVSRSFGLFLQGNTRRSCRRIGKGGSAGGWFESGFIGVGCGCPIW